MCTVTQTTVFLHEMLQRLNSYGVNCSDTKILRYEMFWTENPIKCTVHNSVNKVYVTCNVVGMKLILHKLPWRCNSQDLNCSKDENPSMWNVQERKYYCKKCSRDENP